MKKFNRNLIVSMFTVVSFIFGIAGSTVVFASPAPSLKTAGDFVILAKTAITTTGETSMAQTAVTLDANVVTIPTEETKVTLSNTPTILSCSPSATTTSIGSNVTWSTNIASLNLSNPISSYEFIWNDGTPTAYDESLTSITNSYLATGTKIMNVTVRGADGEKTATCDTEVKSRVTLSDIPVVLSCSPSATTTSIGSNVTWSTNIASLNLSNPISSYEFIWNDGTPTAYDESLTSITNSYLATGTKIMNVTVRGADGEKTATCNTEVKPKVTLDSLTVGQLTCSPNATTTSIGSSVVWSTNIADLNLSDPTSYEFVWNDGIETNYPLTSESITNSYTATGTQTMNVTVRGAEGSFPVTCNVEIRNPSVLTSIISPLTPTVIVGNTRAFSVTTLDQYGVPFTATTTWSSSNTGVGTIDPNTGLFTGVSAGTTNITANVGSSTASTSVTVIRFTGGGGGGSVASKVCSAVGNINGDSKCSVDIFDFNLLMLNWGSTVTGNVADLNNDGIVDILDFNILMLNWTGTL